MICPIRLQVPLNSRLSDVKFSAMTLAEMFKADRRRLGLSQTELGLKIGVTDQAISNIERSVTKKIRPVTLRRFAELSGRTIEEVFAAGDLTPESEQALEIVAAWPAMPAFFTLAVAAGGWVELTGNGTSPSPQQIRQGIFVVKISGDSMTPLWKDADFVMFQTVSLDETQPQPGTDYLFVRNDSEATFKRLKQIDGEEFTLSALNSKKYPNPLKISAQEIVLIAEAKVVWMKRSEV